MKKTYKIALTKNCFGHNAGQVFIVHDSVNCGGGNYNLKATKENEVDPGNNYERETIPSEYTELIPDVGEGYDVEANQGTRDGCVIAVQGSQFLVEYEMPAGRTFGRLFDLGRPGWFRAVNLRKLPKTWEEAVQTG